MAYKIDAQGRIELAAVDSKVTDDAFVKTVAANIAAGHDGAELWEIDEAELVLRTAWCWKILGSVREVRRLRKNIRLKKRASVDALRALAEAWIEYRADMATVHAAVGAGQ